MPAGTASQPSCIVIGGGVIGCAAALRLAQAGVDTVVLERAIPGAEASSAAAGILAAQEESEGEGPLTDLCVLSRGRFAPLAAELRELTGVDIGHRETGLVAVCRDEDGEAALERKYGWQRARGWRVAWLRGDEVQAAEPAIDPHFVAALHFPDDGQVDARALTRALSLAAARAGARFVTGAHVRRVVVKDDRVTGVEVDGAELHAPHVVIAAGSWSSLVEGASVPVRPLRGQIVQLETRPPVVRGTIVSPGRGYVTGRADGRILCGSTMEPVGFDRRVTARGVHDVLALAIALCPSLADAAVTETWANFRPTTGDHLPILGHGRPEGLVFATGHFRNGILLAPITGEIVRDLVTGRTPEVDLAPFTPARLRS